MLLRTSSQTIAHKVLVFIMLLILCVLLSMPAVPSGVEVNIEEAQAREFQVTQHRSDKMLENLDEIIEILEEQEVE